MTKISGFFYFGSVMAISKSKFLPVSEFSEFGKLSDFINLYIPEYINFNFFFFK
jgi:hypothetical protein